MNEMTTEDDMMFLGILKTVDEMDISEEAKGDELMRRFAVVYKEQTENKKFKADPKVLEIVKDTIPEYYL